MEKNFNICANEDQETVFLLHEIKNCSLGTLASQMRDQVQDLAPWGSFMCTGNSILWCMLFRGGARRPWASSLGAHNCQNQHDPVSNQVEGKGQHPRLFSDFYVSINCFMYCQLSYKVSQMHLVNLGDSCVTGWNRLHWARQGQPLLSPLPKWVRNVEPSKLFDG